MMERVALTCNLHILQACTKIDKLLQHLEMNLAEFLTASLDQLSEASGMDKTRWSKYFNGQPISEPTLNKVAQKLDMEPSTLFFGICSRRKKGDCKLMQSHVA